MTHQEPGEVVRVPREPTEAKIIERRAKGFWEAVSALPAIASAIEAGKQFNAYDSAANAEDEADEHCTMFVCIGPISDARHVAEVQGRTEANMIADALTLASRHRLAAAPSPSKAGGERWVPRLGEEVRLSDECLANYEEWRGARLWVSGLRYEAAGVNVTVHEQWPPAPNDGGMDQLFVGRRNGNRDDLLPATPAAPTSEAVETDAALLEDSNAWYSGYQIEDMERDSRGALACKCGGFPRPSGNNARPDDGWRSMWCQGCMEHVVGWCQTEDEAIEKWNAQRELELSTPPATLPASVEGLEREAIANNVIAQVQQQLNRWGGFSTYADRVKAGATGWSQLRSTIWLAVHSALATPKASPDAGGVERLREALEPFAKEADRWEPKGGAYWPDEVPFPANSISGISIGDLRRARQALAALAPKGEGE